jgi:hypothetical protein
MDLDNLIRAESLRHHLLISPLHDTTERRNPTSEQINDDGMTHSTAYQRPGTFPTGATVYF